MPGMFIGNICTGEPLDSCSRTPGTSAIGAERGRRGDLSSAARAGRRRQAWLGVAEAHCVRGRGR